MISSFAVTVFHQIGKNEKTIGILIKTLQNHWGGCMGWRRFKENPYAFHEIWPVAFKWPARFCDGGSGRSHGSSWSSQRQTDRQTDRHSEQI